MGNKLYPTGRVVVSKPGGTVMVSKPGGTVMVYPGPSSILGTIIGTSIASGLLTAKGALSGTITGTSVISGTLLLEQ